MYRTAATTYIYTIRVYEKEGIKSEGEGGDKNTHTHTHTHIRTNNEDTELSRAIHLSSQWCERNGEKNGKKRLFHEHWYMFRRKWNLH